MQLDRVHAGRVELLGQLLGLVLGAGEHHRARRRLGQLDEDGEPLGELQVQHVVGHLDDRGGHRIDAVGDGVVQEPAHQHLDVGVERRAEEQALTAGRGGLEQPPDRREEAEITHVVGLVEHGDLDGIELAVSVADVLLEPAGTRHDDVEPALERRDLRLGTDAAEHGGGPHPECLGERDERGVDLARQLPSRRQHQRPGALRGTPLTGRGQPSEHGKGEGEGLSGARATAAEQIPAGEGIGEGEGLDGKGLLDADGGQGRNERRGKAERAERKRGKL